MGLKIEKGENMDWTIQNTKTFIEIIYDRVKKKLLQGSTFKTPVWEDINNELQKVTLENYGVDRLNGKFNRLRQQHREFSTLLARTGVTWCEANKVNAPEEVWEEMYTKVRFYKQFKRHGFEHDYDVVGEIFNSSTATGKLSQTSTREPPTSDEEKEIEEDFLSKGVHIDYGIIDIDGDDLQEIGKKRKVIGSSREPRRKEAKNSRIDKLEATIDKLSDTISIRAEASRVKAEQYKASIANDASPMSDPYCIEKCMELLDSIDDVSSKIYNIALVKFAEKVWRNMFVIMSPLRRKEWLASLE
ncbi:unnamed protein product [Lupinus luteus]|uniref:Myb/SANT-like domain-containing protein n=1 Tax=Lupinus luteus TaxID=3873 RepID=A0AAV1XEA7_LUPLU